MSVSKRRAVCFVVSDFFDSGYLRAMQMASRKHDVIAVLITDPHELELPECGTGQSAGPGNGADRAVRHRFGRVSRLLCRPCAAAHRPIWNTAFRSAKIDFIHVDSAGSVVDPLARFFRMREKRRQR